MSLSKPHPTLQPLTDAAFTTDRRYTAPDPWRYPRRAADGSADVRKILSPLFPLKRRGIEVVKWMLRF